MDGLIIGLDRALRVISGVASAARPTPAARLPDTDLSEIERRHNLFPDVDSRVYA